MTCTLQRYAAAIAMAWASAAAGAQETPAAPPPSEVGSSAGRIRVERLATLEFPWGMALLPDGRVLITEKPGRLRIWSGGRLSDPVGGVPAVVYRGPPFEQGGLLDVAVDPDFARNGYVYLSYTEAAAQQPGDLGETGDARFGDFIDFTDNVLRGGAVARGRLVGSQLQGVQVIWRQVPKTVGRGHFGHRLLFGPDGKLYITSGDRMRFDPAQRLASNLGKVVRINPDGSIPVDNPFNGRENARGDVYSLGHRNILAATFDQGGRLWVFEMGPQGGDEINLVQPGRNYGWPLVSNGDNYAGASIPDHPTRDEFQAPVRSWTPVVSPSGALQYSGDLFPGWRGSILLGGLSSRALVRLVLDGDRVALEERVAMGRRMRDLLQLPDGSILAIVDDRRGDLLRLAPAR
jgi:aldose sugar dehydrogenase